MCYVDHIVVEEEFRGKGVGKVLLETAENAAREKKCNVSKANLRVCLVFFLKLKFCLEHRVIHEIFGDIAVIKIYAICYSDVYLIMIGSLACGRDKDIKYTFPFVLVFILFCLV